MVNYRRCELSSKFGMYRKLRRFGMSNHHSGKHDYKEFTVGYFTAEMRGARYNGVTDIKDRSLVQDMDPRESAPLSTLNISDK